MQANHFSILGKYQNALNRIPAPGWGCHPALLSAANYGVMAGKDPEQLKDEIHQAIPDGKRRVREQEVTDAVNKALQDHQNKHFTPKPRPKPIIQDGEKALQKIIDQGQITDDADLWEASPIRLLNEPDQDPALLLETLFEDNDLLFIGERYQAGLMGDTIRTAGQWKTHFNGGATSPHIIINPLDGVPRATRTGDSMTLRGDANVKPFRYCLIEFDNLSREKQIRFFSAVKLPVVALIDTAGKSIHAWIDVQKLLEINTLEDWESQIKIRLYDRILKPLGVDGACSNPARLSRLPGHIRDGKFQKILWLSREGKPIC